MHIVAGLAAVMLAPTSVGQATPGEGPLPLPVLSCAGTAAMGYAAKAAAGKPSAVDPWLFAEAMARLRWYGCEDQAGRMARSLLVVDFGLHAARPRAWLIDLRTGRGMTDPMLVAHGSGSDRAPNDGFAEAFSDREDSLMSSLGAYRVGEEYFGKHERSLRLDGLEPSNRSARARAIVIHSADYVSTVRAEASGTLGLSWGCFVFERSRLDEVVAALSDGGFVYAGLSDRSHLKPIGVAATAARPVEGTAAALPRQSP